MIGKMSRRPALAVLRAVCISIALLFSFDPGLVHGTPEPGGTQPAKEIPDVPVGDGDLETSGTGHELERKSESRDLYIRTNLNELTGNSTIPALPFDLIFPDGYVSVRQEKNPGLLLMHVEDVKAVNQKGGELDPAYLAYPMFRIDVFGLVRYDYRSGKFNLEQDRKSNIPTKRLDRRGMPILLVEFNEKGKKEDWLLVKMHPRSPVLLISHTQPVIDRDLVWQPSRRHWNHFLSHVAGASVDARNATLPEVELEPVIPDDDAFPRDIFINDNATPMQLPDALPVPLHTTEEELYQTHPEESLRRRLTFKTPRSLSLDQGAVEFHRFLSYQVESDVRGKVNPRVYGYETHEFFAYNIYIKDGIVQTFVLIHLVREGQELVIGPKSWIPECYPTEPGDSPLGSFITDYCLSRSPSFRRNVAHRKLLLEDYLIGSRHKNRYLERINAEYETDIPEEIIQFEALEELTLGPLERISCKVVGLKNLKKMVFSGQSLNELPACLKDLRVDFLSIQNFAGWEIPLALQKNQHIESLFLKDGYLQSLPDHVSDWKNLEELNLKNNQVRAVSPGFIQAPALRFVDLSGNEFRHWPGELLQLPRIGYINLAENKISEIPEDLCEKLAESEIRINLYENPLDEPSWTQASECEHIILRKP